MQPFSPLTWYRHSLKGAKSPQGAKVPCGSCTACCSGVDVELVAGADGDFSRFYLNPDAVRPTLQRQVNGDCHYLRDGICTIYDQRPYVCRQYDCRAQLVTQITQPAHLYAAAAEKFELVCKAPDDAPWLETVRQRAIDLQARGVAPAQIMYQALDGDLIARLEAKRAARLRLPR